MLSLNFTHRIFMLFVVGMILFTITGCQTQQAKNAQIQAVKGANEAGVQHVVLLWLKDGEDGQKEAALAEVRKAAEGLRLLESVNKIYIGTAIPGRDGIVDSSFDIAFVMQFANKQDLKTYLDHPEHMKQVRYVLEPNAHRIIVYDVEYN